MRTPFLILLCFLAGLTVSYSQIVADSIANGLPLVNNTNVQALRTDLDAAFKEVANDRTWAPYDSTYYSNAKTAIWLKFELKNTTADTVLNYIFSEDNYVTTYQEMGKKVSVYRNGTLFVPSQRTNKLEYKFTKITLAPLENSKVYIRLNSNNTLLGPSYPSLYSEKGYWELSRRIHENQSGPIGFIYFYISALITILLFALVFWFRLREKLYFYYLGYLFFQLVYGFQVLRTTTASVGNIFQYIPELSNTSFQAVQFAFIGFYVLFISKLLTIRRYDRLLNKILRYLGIFCFLYAVSQFVFNYFFYGMAFADTLFVMIRLIILPLNFVLIFWIIYKVKHPLLVYFIIGQSFFFIGAVLASYVGYSEFYLIPDHFFNFPQAPNIIFQIGLLAEVFCFSLALGKNIFLLQREKEKTNARLIAQLQQNKRLQESMNKELDKKVNEKTTELIELYSEIEREKEEKIKRDFEQKIRETEMIALRSQMNPHFIFNSLNAIKHLIMTSRNDDAIAYLDDFSTLLRSILKNSNQKKITVEEELDTLELYLSLEQNRMGTDFTYTIDYPSREALSQYHIPPLLLQPFVENAIWHGLQPSLKSEKKLSIIFDTTENLQIIIEDNGIGRQESAKKKKLHNSLGTTLAQDRLTLHNHLSDYTILLKITDVKENGSIYGTRVTLTYEY